MAGQLVAEPVVTEPQAPVATEPVATAPAEPKPRTVEEVEAEYKARISGKDRAHAETEKVLREQIAALQAAPTIGSDGQPVANSQREAQLEALLAEERQARVLDSRKAKFPAAAETLDDRALAIMDEAKLAGLQARLEGTVTPVVDNPADFIAPTSPVRQPAAPVKSYDEMTVEELNAEAAKIAPAFVAGLNS